MAQYAKAYLGAAAALIELPEPDNVQAIEDNKYAENVTLAIRDILGAYHYCDVNRDGVVNQLDITRAQRSYGAQEGNDAWNPNADVNKDGKVDIDDIILIMNNYTE